MLRQKTYLLMSVNHMLLVAMATAYCDHSSPEWKDLGVGFL